VGLAPTGHVQSAAAEHLLSRDHQRQTVMCVIDMVAMTTGLT